METDAGRAVMKTPATKAKALFKVVKPTSVATTLSIFRAVDNHLNELNLAENYLINIYLTWKCPYTCNF